MVSVAAAVLLVALLLSVDFGGRGHGFRALSDEKVTHFMSSVAREAPSGGGGHAQAASAIPGAPGLPAGRPRSPASEPLASGTAVALLDSSPEFRRLWHGELLQEAEDSGEGVSGRLAG